MTATDGYSLTRGGEEVDRLNKQQLNIIRTLGYITHPKIRLPSAPKVAEFATGTGAWLLTLQPTLSRDTQLIGYDISSDSFPPAADLPDNISLRVHNVTKPFPESEQGTYDLVNIRLLVCAMENKDWIVNVAKNALSLLKPGGHVQWMDSLAGIRVVRGAGASAATSVLDTAIFKTWDAFESQPRVRSKYELIQSVTIGSCLAEAGAKDVQTDMVASDATPESRRALGEGVSKAAWLVCRNKAKAGEGSWSTEDMGALWKQILREYDEGFYLRWDMVNVVATK